MNVYGYSDMYIIVSDNEDRYIIYNSYSNKVIALNDKGYELFSEILDKAKENGGEIDENKAFFIDSLNEAQILFSNKIDYLNANFKEIYLKERRIRPYKAYLHLTQTCNLHCDYCYNRQNLGSVKDMTTATWKSIISKLYDKGFNNIVFTGGEVTLRNDLEDLAKFVKSFHMRLTILTNGTRWISSEIFEYVDSVEISLDDSNNKKNSSHRKNSEQFQIWNKLQAYDQSQKEKIVIKTVVTKNNQDRIGVLRDDLKAIGIENISLMPCQPTNKDQDTYPTKVVSRTVHKFEAGKVAKCNGCYEVIAINANGDIYPCQAMIKETFQLCSIFDENWFESILKSQITKNFYNDNILINECKNCGYKYLCGGPCKAVAFHKEGSIWKGRGKFCDFAKRECDEYLRSIDFGEDER